ncbi:hypothetical protein LTSEWAN_5271, partial [Salmonella enterica subsp. enterica serovar Wandsworth str. A4-580]
MRLDNTGTRRLNRRFCRRYLRFGGLQGGARARSSSNCC